MAQNELAPRDKARIVAEGLLGSVHLAQAPQTLLEEILLGRKAITNPEHILAEIQALTPPFEEGHHWWQVGEDLIGLIRRTAHGKESYKDKYRKEEAKGGPLEAASHRIAMIGDHKVVWYMMHWNFFNGTLGVAAGEEFQETVDLALEEDAALLGVLSTGGVRQHENFPGLAQMTRIVHAGNLFKRRSRKPYGAIILGQSWGGVSVAASALADFKAGFKGSDNGFAGGRIKQANSEEEPPPGSQSVENHAIHRTLEVLVDSPQQMLEYTEGLLDNLTRERRGKRWYSLAPARSLEQRTPRDLAFSPPGFRPLILPSTGEADPPTKPLFPKEKTRDNLLLRYMMLGEDPSRLDTEFLMHNSFSNFRKFYSPYIAGGKLHYPAIIAGIGRIGEQPFLVIGNQPSYERTKDGGIKRTAAVPGNPDLRYARKMMSLGHRYRIPGVFITDTPGADGSLEADLDGLADELGYTMSFYDRYQNPTIACILGQGASGGMMVTTPLGDYVMMFEYAMVMASNPTSAASMLYRGQTKPTYDQMYETVTTMATQAQDQLRLGLIQEIIREEVDGRFLTNDELALSFRNSVAAAYLKLDAYSIPNLLKERDKNIRGLRGLSLERKQKRH